MLRYLILVLSIFIATTVFAGVDCDGTDDFLNSSSATATSLPLTIIVWFNADSVTGVQTLFSMTNGSNSYARLFLFGDDVGAQLQDDGGSSNFSRTTSTIGIGEWHMATAVFPSGTEQESYLDDTDSDTNTSIDETPTISEMAACRNSGNGTTYEYFNGKIGEVMIFDTDLTQAQISEIYNSQVRYYAMNKYNSNTKGYWTLDEEESGSSSDGDTFFDKSGNGDDLTGDDGANNTGLTALGEQVLSYP